MAFRRASPDQFNFLPSHLRTQDETRRITPGGRVDCCAGAVTRGCGGTSALPKSPLGFTCEPLSKARFSKVKFLSKELKDGQTANSRVAHRRTQANADANSAVGSSLAWWPISSKNDPPPPSWIL